MFGVLKKTTFSGVRDANWVNNYQLGGISTCTLHKQGGDRLEVNYAAMKNRTNHDLNFFFDKIKL